MADEVVGAGEVVVPAAGAAAAGVRTERYVLARFADDRGLLPALDPAAAGCWNARTIAGTNRPSAHAWGAAIDLVPFTSDPAAVEVLERWGLTWGGRWLDPDPVHFEYVRPAKAR